MQGSGFRQRAREAPSGNSPTEPHSRPGTAEREAHADATWSATDGEDRYRALAEALDRAESENDAKSRFLATVSHEIRTPLNGILGLTAVLQDTELTAEQENFVRAIRASGGLLLGLVNDMLDLARIEAGGLELEPAPANPAELVQEVVELLAPRAFARGIDIVAHAAPNLPPEVTIDGPRLRQALLNLAGNAVKFTERGGVTVEVAPARVAHAPARLDFIVADSGPGMDGEAITRLRAAGEVHAGPVSRPFHGAGLGLPIAGEIIRRMGGEIAVTARPGGGTVVSFSIPGETDFAFAQPAKPAATRRCLILVPDETGGNAAARYLAGIGVEARLVPMPQRAAALAAAAAAAGQSYSFVMIDARAVAAPAAALAAIREAAGARLPAAILIEPGNRKSVPALREAGFDAYLVRPFRRASLLRIAGALLDPDGDVLLDAGDAEKAGGRPVHAPRRALEVLVVEDNEINALLLRAILERLGHRVEELRDGRAALAAATGRRFDLILIDLNLPGMDGIEVARAIRAGDQTEKARAVLLAVTGDGAPAARADALAAGFDGLLEKPVEPETVRDLLERMEFPAGG